MVRDLLGYKIKNYKHLRMFNYMEKYYIYNNNIYQIIRICKHFKLDGGNTVDMFVQNIKTKKRSNITLSLDNFLEKKLYDRLPKLKDNKKFIYNFCYFENKEMKRNFDIMDELYDLGYENYSRTTSISFHTTPFSIIENGKILTADKVDFTKYRNLFDIFGK